MVLTGTLFLCPQGRAETLDRLFQVVLVLLHILNGLVALGEEALKSANLGEKPAADLKCKFYMEKRKGQASFLEQ